MDKAAHLATAAELDGTNGMGEDMVLSLGNSASGGMRGVEENTARSKGTPLGALQGITEITYSKSTVRPVDPFRTRE